MSFIEEARRKFVAESAYLDDRPGRAHSLPRRSQPHARSSAARSNTSMPAKTRAYLDDCIRGDLQWWRWRDLRGDPLSPAAPSTCRTRLATVGPRLIVLAYDGVAIGSAVESVPELIARIHSREGLGRLGAAGAAQQSGVPGRGRCPQGGNAAQNAYRRLALQDLKKPRTTGGSRGAPAGQDPRARSPLGAGAGDSRPAVLPPRILPVAKPYCTGSDVDLEHTAIDVQSTSDRPWLGTTNK